MKREELRKILMKEPRKVTFIKRNGERREMYCTLRKDVVSQHWNGSFGNTKEPAHLLTVWDIMVQGWRRVNLETLENVETFEF